MAYDKKSKKKGKEGKDKDCPFQVKTNDASWYLRDGTPRFSGEFDDLQKIGVTPKVLPNGIRLDTSVLHTMVVAPPIDAEDSFYKQAATLLSKVRKKNTGSNIYTIDAVAVYMWKYLCAVTMAAQVAKEIAAVGHVMPGNADSPWVSLNIVSPNLDWEAEAKVLADTKNEADIVFKMIDALPAPKFTALDRNMMIFSNMFADSKGGKPSFTTFYVDTIMDLEIRSGTVNVVKRNAGRGSPPNNTISEGLKIIRDILDDIYTDNGANYTMLRGDLMKYWRPQPVALGMLYKPLQIAAMSSELAAQLENATVLGRLASANSNDTTGTFAPGSSTLHVELAGILNPDIDCKGELDDQPINSRSGVPSDGELMAITALMPIVEQVNGATSSYWNVLAHNGLFIHTTYALAATSKNRSGITLTSIGEALANVHSSVQSTMKNAFVDLQWVSSIIAHSPIFITDDQDPKGFIWDVDYIGVISKNSLATAITRVVRSLYQVDLPERDY